MSLWCNLQQGVQVQYDLHNKMLGKCCELAHLPGIFIQCLQFQQNMALQFLQWLQQRPQVAMGIQVCGFSRW